jgi:hypothetical protein
LRVPDMKLRVLEGVRRVEVEGAGVEGAGHRWVE